MAKATKTKSAASAPLLTPEVPAPAPVPAAPAAPTQTFFDVLVGPLQLRVLHVLWAMPERTGTVHAVHAALNGQGRSQLAYTTILTVMRNLARRGVVSQRSLGRQHIFQVLDDQPTYERRLAKTVIADLFGGDKKRFLTLVQA